MATGLVTHIHVTDSDDSSSVGLFSVKIESGPNNGTGVTVQVSNISSASLEYGYSYDNDPNHVIQWQNDSHFADLKPNQYYFFARVKETSDHVAGGTSAPYAYRVKTPSPASQESVAALGLGTSLFRPYNGTHQYIWYGTEHGENGTGTEEPILWRVLDTKTNMQTAGLFLLSDKLYGTGTDGGLHFSEQAPYRNDYSDSSARRWCQNFAQAHLNPLEQSAILPTSKTDTPYASVFDGAPYILSNDKVFLPSAEEISSKAYGFGTDAGRQGRYRSDSFAYWLRSPAAQERGNAGYIDATGAVAQGSTTACLQSGRQSGPLCGCGQQRNGDRSAWSGPDPFRAESGFPSCAEGCGPSIPSDFL